WRFSAPDTRADEDTRNPHPRLASCPSSRAASPARGLPDPRTTIGAAMKSRVIQDEPNTTPAQAAGNGAPGSPLRPMNLAARAGRWSAQHRKKAIWGWLGCVVLAFAIGNAVGTKTQDAAQSGVGQSG